MAGIKEKNTPSVVTEFFLRNGSGGYSDVSAWLKTTGVDISPVSVKRALSALAKSGVLAIHGAGRATRYVITSAGRIFADIDAEAYCASDPDRRYGQSSYNFDLFAGVPARIMTEDEIGRIDVATAAYRSKIKNASDVAHRKELERFVIELSWKSSKIEGNTYSLLDTEKLFNEGVSSPKYSKEETAMVLNHKTAFQEVFGNREEFKTLTRQNLERLHAALVRGLGVSTGLRRSLVGVTGSKYRPLENVFQVEEAVDSLSAAIGRLGSGVEKALLALLGISYIQPFDDGNKRTARLMANAILLAHGLSPLSYRSVDEEEYRRATLVFYEVNSLVPFKRIFIEQYEFAAKNYAVG